MKDSNMSHVPLRRDWRDYMARCQFLGCDLGRNVKLPFEGGQAIFPCKRLKVRDDIEYPIVRHVDSLFQRLTKH
jgi:hypothetical protein